MADLKQDVRSVANFLKVSKIKVQVNSVTKTPVATANGISISGLGAIVSFLADKSGHIEIAGGDDIKHRAMIQQWLEYRVTDLDRCQGVQDVNIVLKELNCYLASRVYFVGDHLTLADLLICYGLHRILSTLTLQEKEKYIHVSRWFDHMQHTPGVRQQQSLVPFAKNQLYLGALSH
ncbi:eukaryotic translation elongation factor 1 epsilon-1-like [Amphiura filiformis]|uniref:eukaryotic translation elongation factor 1 epsilon-1-like n=1 Tax=Amphiura filiformis TaxID=82378 RepID=UPI003B22544F